MTRYVRFVLNLLIALAFAYSADAACKGRQSYVLSLQLSFTRNILPTVPQKAQIPVVVAVAHSSSFNLFKKGDKVEDPVAEVAETYRTDTIERQLKSLIANGDTVSSYDILSDPPVDKVSRFQLNLRDDASRVSLMAPLSPSPAWFVGIDSLDLCSGDKFIEEKANITVNNFHSGLDEAQSFETKDPYPEGETIPVGPAPVGTYRFAALSLEQGTLGGVNWWKIFLGVLVAVVVLFVMFVFIYPRCRKKRSAEIPLTAQDGVEW